jgi:hypothetical protein
MTTTLFEKIGTLRRMGAHAEVRDTLGLEERDPVGWAVARAKAAAERRPFAQLIAEIDRYFGDELDEAFTGPERADAETEARRIIAEHLASATIRLALSAAGGHAVQWVTASPETLGNLASTALQRAADLRFVEIVTPAAAAPR